jgi:membrane-associated phospholipid phosphatase
MMIGAQILRMVGFALAGLLASAAPALAKSNTFKSYGDVFRYVLPASTATLALMQDDLPGLGQFAASGALTIGLTTGLKYSIDSTRPNGGKHSFPSGHTSAAFLGAAFIHERYGWQLGLPAEALAVAVAVSRVDAKAHHWRDVIASAVIAHASAYALVDPRNNTVLLVPWIDGPKPSFGLVGRLRF